MARPKKDRNITRIDSTVAEGKQEAHGYEVRIVRRGQSVHRFFADKKAGGKRKALEAARSFRDGAEAKLKPMSRKEKANLLTSKNTSGVPGVRWTEKTIAKGKKTYAYWFAVATWSPQKGVRKTASFSCDKYGEQKAWDMAVKARKAGVKAMEDA
ncbi:MAG: AP2 domain-containing protein [Verrucomicrobiota bacterium]